MPSTISLPSAEFERVFEAVKTKLLQEFLHPAVQEAIEGAVTKRQEAIEGVLTKRQKFEAFNGDSSGSAMRQIYLQNFGYATSSSSARPSSGCLDLIAGTVFKLFEIHGGNQECLGSFVFIDAKIGITAFHSVVRGKNVLDGHTLFVDNYKLQHVASWPFYDLSFYRASDRPEDAMFLRLGESTGIFKRSELFVAGFPALDNKSKDLKEEVLITPGSITRVCSASGFDFVTGAYSCCKGMSGGAVVDPEGLLLGMHLMNEFQENTTYFTLNEDISSRIPEDYRIRSPSTYFRYGKQIDKDEERFLGESSSTLARYFAENVPSKSDFGCFLSVVAIRKKFTSLCLMNERNAEELE